MPFFGKIMENVRKHRDIKLVAIERRRNYLVLEPYFHTTKFFREKVLAIEINKTEIVMNRPVYLGPSILELSIILMYEFRYDYVKPKYDKNAKLFDIDTDSFIHSFTVLYTKTDYIYKDIAEDVETRFGTPNYELDRPKGKDKKATRSMKNELGIKIMIHFVGLRAKTYSYLINESSED